MSWLCLHNELECVELSHTLAWCSKNLPQIDSQQFSRDAVKRELFSTLALKIQMVCWMAGKRGKDSKPVTGDLSRGPTG